jgi:transcriptional regulator with XRE-family HTH domain
LPTVGERIRQVRELRGLTQEKLANEAGISKGFLSEVENKGRNLSLDVLLRIATVLHASVEYLAKGEGVNPDRSEPVVIPRELSLAAEQLNLSFQETVHLLEAYKSVIARRSSKFKREFAVEDWKDLHAALSAVWKRIYG